MTGELLTPIIVGVGDVKNRSQRVEDAVEPMQLMIQATLLALQDTNLPSSAVKDILSEIDSLDVIATWTWPYHDLPGLLARKLNVQPQYKKYSAHGGNQPVKVLDEAARRISKGESKIAIVTGGEALASLSACVAAQKMPPRSWPEPEPNVQPFSVSDTSLFTKGMSIEAEAETSRAPHAKTQIIVGIGSIHSVGLPIHVYAMYENGFRAHRGQSIDQNDIESGKLYAEFSQVAEQNQMSWNFGQRAAATEDTIRTVTKHNRMISFPYPLLMNAFNNVNLAASCILTSTEYARKVGIPESQWIYPLGAAGTQDSDNFWERPNFYSSPAISRSLDACLETSGLSKEQISLFDLYSCFPIVPKLACQHLGLPLVNSPRPITLLGGLTSFGGAGNNYSMHSLTAMVRELRKGKHENGLILANGGVLTYQHAICLSSQPRRNGTAYPTQNPLPPLLTDISSPPIDTHADGEANIETYTVEFNRDGTPLRGHIIGRLTKNSHRFVANASDRHTLEQLSSTSTEQIGKRGWVKRGDRGRNLFTLDQSAKL